MKPSQDGVERSTQSIPNTERNGERRRRNINDRTVLDDQNCSSARELMLELTGVMGVYAGKKGQRRGYQTGADRGFMRAVLLGRSAYLLLQADWPSGSLQNPAMRYVRDFNDVHE